jgi:hypothetical protein
MVTCKICNAELKNFNSLQKHIRFSHKEIDIEDYYDKFILKGSKPKCVFCGKNCSLLGFTKGYKKICSSKECISKSRATYTIEYGMKMEGLSEIEAEKRLENLNKSRVKTFKKTTHEILKDNPNFNKEKSHQCVEYWLKRGFSKKEAEIKIKDVLENLHQKTWDKRRKNPELYKDVNTAQILFWIKKGYSEEDARNKVSERQETFSKRICLEKYGYKKGMEIFLARQEKWIESLNKNGKLKMGYSEISQKLFRQLEDNDYTFYGEKNHEYNIGPRRYDYTDLNKRKIIEFNGDVYHGNPSLYKENDNPHPYLKHLTAKDLWDMDQYKKELAEEKGFEFLVIWESEYKENPGLTLEKCKQFLND